MSAAPAIAGVMESKAKKVTVACKMPNGLILRLYKMIDATQLMPGGGSYTHKQAAFDERYSDVRLNGAGIPGTFKPYRVVGGYALTPGVDGDFMREWMKQNSGSDLVKNGIVYIMDSANDAAARAKEQKEVVSGLEQLDVSTKRQNGKTIQKDYRWPRKADSKNVSNIASDSESMADGDGVDDQE